MGQTPGYSRLIVAGSPGCAPERKSEANYPIAWLGTGSSSNVSVCAGARGRHAGAGAAQRKLKVESTAGPGHSIAISYRLTHSHCTATIYPESSAVSEAGAAAQLPGIAIAAVSPPDDVAATAVEGRSMQAKETTLVRLLEGEKQYLVPLYQRTYRWGCEQIATLWADILSQAESVDEAGSSPGHFLGSLVLAPPPKNAAGGVQRWIVVDGQQRLTTLLVALAALRDHVRAEDATSAERIQYERGAPIAVADAKYKAEKPSGFPDADLYQLLAYCTALNLAHEHLIYAKGNAEHAHHVVRNAEIEIHCHALDLEVPPGALLAQIGTLAAQLADPSIAAASAPPVGT